MKPRFLRQSFQFLLVVLLLVTSAACLSYSHWVREVTRGNDALATGDLAGAQKHYDTAALRYASLPWGNRIASGVSRKLLFNRVRVLYATNRTDELARLLDAEAARRPEIAADSEYQFWSGNLQFQRAIAQKEKQQLQNGLQQASESYRRAVAASPEDWDFKYDYELTVRLLDSLRKGKDQDLETMKRGQMKILREDNHTGKEEQRPVAPAKRS
jgi:hypothetical protein